MPKIRRRQRLSKTSSFYSSVCVVAQASEPYGKVGMTTALKMCSLVLRLTAGPCHFQAPEGLLHQHSPCRSSAMIVQSPEVGASVLSNIPADGLSHFLRRTKSITTPKSSGVHTHPWRTPVSTLNQSVLSPSTMSAASQFSYTQRMSGGTEK